MSLKFIYVYLCLKLLLHSSGTVSQIGFIDFTKEDNVMLVGLAFVQMVACRLFSAMLLSEPMWVYCQLDHREQTSVKVKNISFTGMRRKMLSAWWRPFCPGGDGLTLWFLERKSNFVKYISKSAFTSSYTRVRTILILCIFECWINSMPTVVQVVAELPFSVKPFFEPILTWCGADIGPEITSLISPTTNLPCTHDSFVTSHEKANSEPVLDCMSINFNSIMRPIFCTCTFKIHKRTLNLYKDLYISYVYNGRWECKCMRRA